MEYLATAIGVVIAVLGWYINGLNRLRDELSDMKKQANDLRVETARLSSRADAHADGMLDIKRQMGDVLENMARRSDVEHIMNVLGDRIDDALNRRK